MENSPTIKVTGKKFNIMCILSLVFGFASITLFWIVPQILAITFGIIGLARFDNQSHKGKWMAIIGIIVGIIYLLIAYNFYM